MSYAHSKAKSFIDIQYTFSAYLRDPENKPAPVDIEQRRMTVYRELFYNNMNAFISNAFPVLRQIIADEVWHSMVRDFMIKHHCKTPLFHQIASEFLIYLDDERDDPKDPIFMKELAHYEWIELSLSILDAEVSPVQIEMGQDSLTLVLQTSSLARPLAYHYPVHQIGPDFQPHEASDLPIFLLAYRNQHDTVSFLELNPISARLIDLLNEGLTGQIAAKHIAQELQHPKPQVIIDNAKTLIDDWLQKEILTYRQ